MDTQETGTTEEQSSTEQTEETTTSDTSTDGVEEDVDSKRIADKEAYLKELDRQIKEKEAIRKAKKSEPEDQDDVITWMALNADGMKLCPKEFQEELGFYKSHKIPITNEIRDRALRDARARKGVRNVEADRQTATSSEVQGEMRKTSKVENLPHEVEHLAKEGGTKITPEQYAKYKAEFDGGKKKR